MTDKPPKEIAAQAPPDTDALPPIVTSRSNDNQHGHPKLTTAETALMLKDAAQGMTLDQLADRYGICADTVSKYIHANSGRLSAIKQDIAGRCLQIATRAQEKITDAKLEASSASQLTTIAREQVYTSIMLMDGKTPDGGKIQIDQLIIQTANLLNNGNLQQNVDKSKDK